MRVLGTRDDMFDVMTIHEAVNLARKSYNWGILPSEMLTTVNIGFIREEDNEFFCDETQVDLPPCVNEDGKEHELVEFWHELYSEMSSQPDYILYVEEIVHSDCKWT